MIAVAGCVLAWSTAFRELLEDDEVEVWTEEVLERLKGGGVKLKINLEVLFSSILSPALRLNRNLDEYRAEK